MGDSCQNIRPLLSAFYDGELAAEIAARVSRHVQTCPGCEAELQSFERIAESMKATAAGEPSPLIWDSIEREMGAPEPVHRGRAPVQGWNVSPLVVGMISLAASVLLLVGAGIWFSARQDVDVRPLAQTDAMPEHSNPHSAEHSSEFVHVMDEYLRTLPADPDKAELLLLKRYHGERVDNDRAAELVGYRPLVANGLPAGYSIASTSVLRMPCCTCVKAVCRRDDGSTLVLFEHDDEQMTWFGDRQANVTTCGDKECCLVELDENLAATWKEGSRSVTAVGARDQEEVARLVTWMQNSRTNG